MHVYPFRHLHALVGDHVYFSSPCVIRELIVLSLPVFFLRIWSRYFQIWNWPCSHILVICFRTLVFRVSRVVHELYRTWGNDFIWVWPKRLYIAHYVCFQSVCVCICLDWVDTVASLQQCVSLVLSLISSSLDAWRTRQYDYYQRVLNGILWEWRMFHINGS